MSRRFLYLVVENGLVNPLSYTLHRINPSRLFYPKDSPERAAAVAAAAAGARATTVEAAKASADVDVEKAVLPRPTMTFPSPSGYMDFALSGRNKDQIVAVDRTSRFRTGEEGCAVDRAVLYNDASHSVVALPGLTAHQTDAVPVAVGDDLYFVGVEEDDHKIFVRGLTRGLGPDYDQYPDWHWHSFPPPLYVGQGSKTQGHHSVEVASCAVVGGWYIWASTRGYGTYSLYTENGEWSKVSDSALPFRGPAVYAPEHALWFGFLDDSRYMRLVGAWDLHAGADAPVEGTGVWDGIAKPCRSYNSRPHLVHLGDGGRFCVAQLFERTKPPPASRCARCYYDSDPPQMGFAELTGVEVERCDGGELRMIKHRSCKYSLGLNSAHALL